MTERAETILTPFYPWAASYNIWLLIELTLKGDSMHLNFIVFFFFSFFLF